jgi:tetratricopeptide (TPR) repeat protein
MPFAADVAPQAPGGAGATLWLGEAAAVLLSDSLSDLGVDTLSREERVAAFDEVQLPMSAALTRATMIRVGELMGASEVLFGEVTFDTRLEVRVRRIHVESGRELPTVSDNASLEDIFALFARLASRIAVGADVRRVASPLAPLSLEAFENYAKGLVATSPSAQQRFLEAALREAPSDPRVLMALTSVYTAQGLHDNALAAANAIPSDSRLRRRARFAVALSLLELKRFDGAYQELTTLHASRGSGALSNALGLVELRRNPTPAGANAAIPYFRRAVAEAPQDTDYLFNLGYGQALAGNVADALTSLREVVRLDAADGDAHLVMSALLFVSGRTPEAQRELELARLLGTSVESTAPISSRVPPGLERVSGALDATSLAGVSAAMSGPARSDQRETAAFHVTRARELIAERRDRDAMNELRRAIYLEPYEDQPHLLLGRIYLRAGETDLAIDEFKVALWCRETAEAHLSLARALLTGGDREGARSAASRALALDPSSAEARELLRESGG